MKVTINNIPVESLAIAEIVGKLFSATLYKLPNGRVAAAVAVDPDATAHELAAEHMNSRICEESKNAAGCLPDFYQINRLPLGG